MTLAVWHYLLLKGRGASRMMAGVACSEKEAFRHDTAAATAVDAEDAADAAIHAQRHCAIPPSPKEEKRNLRGHSWSALSDEPRQPRR